ncbi:PREDICTED: protein FAM173A-like [Calidris pugnax]|uniref:protein FAM173A-like n=1 Tax=Calidris pugnax TaxID=198806 RepID=UPI00071E2647|nr:PREDICTED: protein FAM173A-like [Calidris pugnax]
MVIQAALDGPRRPYMVLDGDIDSPRLRSPCPRASRRERVEQGQSPGPTNHPPNWTPKFTLVATLLSPQVVEAYKQGLSPAVGYELNPWLLCLANYRAWKAGYHGKVSFLKKDLWKVNLSDCSNVIVFLAPSVKPPLAAKLLAELPDEARVVAGRFPFPSWPPSSTLGQGLEQVWAYDMKEVRRAAQREAPSNGSLVKPRH